MASTVLLEGRPRLQLKSLPSESLCGFLLYLYEENGLLKNLMAVGVPIIFFGLPSAYAYLMQEHQLSRRCTLKVFLVPFGMGDEARRKTFRMRLKSLHTSPPLPLA